MKDDGATANVFSDAGSANKIEVFLKDSENESMGENYEEFTEYSLNLYDNNIENDFTSLWADFKDTMYVGSNLLKTYSQNIMNDFQILENILDILSKYGNRIIKLDTDDAR